MSFLKRRPVAEPGSIPAVLGMFEAEVRFYQEIAPVLGVRVPVCLRAESSAEGTVLELEDLSHWELGADPVQAAGILRSMHDRWADETYERWPWLRTSLAGVDLVAGLFDRTWPGIAARPDCPASVKELGRHLLGRVQVVERTSAAAGGRGTLVHGDASAQNMRTSRDGEIALLDWEDVGWASGVGDLAWLVVSSVEAELWDEVVHAYGEVSGLAEAWLPAAVQGLLSFSDTAIGSEEAVGWALRLGEVSRRTA